VKWLWFCFS